MRPPFIINFYFIIQNMMKTYLMAIVGIMVLTLQFDVITAAASGNCNYCKHQDTIAGPLYSFGYCKTTDKCYEDVWNH